MKRARQHVNVRGCSVWELGSILPTRQSVNVLNYLGTEKSPLERKVEFGLQLGSGTYKCVGGKGTPDGTKLGRKKQHD